MGRAKCSDVILSHIGTDVTLGPLSTITLYDAGTDDPITDTIYAGYTGGTTLSNPFTADEHGNFEFYLEFPRFVKIGVSIPDVGDVERDYIPVFADPSTYLMNPEPEIVDPILMGDNLRFRRQGPIAFDLEAYVNDEDLHANGMVIEDVDVTYAFNAAFDAIRDAKLSNGIFGAPFRRTLVLNSHTYSIKYSIDGNFLPSCHISSGITGTIVQIYCTEDWTGAFPGSVGEDEGLTPSQCFMLELIGTADLTVHAVDFSAAITFTNTSPTIAPAGCILQASTEQWDEAEDMWSGESGYEGTYPAGANSNNNQFYRCGVSGQFTYTGWAYVNSVIMYMSRCGSQAWRNEDQTCAFYAGRTVLNTTGNPDINGTAFDSVYYPNPATPVDAQYRICRNEIGCGSIFIQASEMHDMSPNTYATNNQSNKVRTILLHKTIGMMFDEFIVSCSGVGGHFQFDYWSRHVEMRLVEPYNKGDVFGSNTKASYFIYTTHVDLANPLFTMRIKNFKGGGSPQTGWFGAKSEAGSNAPAYVGLYIDESIFDTSVPFFKTLGGYGGLDTDVNLSYSDIDLFGCSIELGGSIGPTVHLKNPGTIQYSSATGTELSRKTYTDGRVSNRGYQAPYASSALTTPPANHGLIYPKTDGYWYKKKPDGTEVLLQDDENKYSFHVTSTANQTINDSTVTAVVFDGTDRFDASGMHNPASNNTRVVAPIAGKYLVIGSLRWGNVTADGNAVLQIRKDGTTMIGENWVRLTSGNPYGTLVIAEWDMNINSYIELMVTHFTGNNDPRVDFVTNNSPNLFGFRIGS